MSSLLTCNAPSSNEKKGMLIESVYGYSQIRIHDIKTDNIVLKKDFRDSSKLGYVDKVVVKDNYIFFIQGYKYTVYLVNDIENPTIATNVAYITTFDTSILVDGNVVVDEASMFIYEGFLYFCAKESQDSANKYPTWFYKLNIDNPISPFVVSRVKVTDTTINSGAGIEFPSTTCIGISNDGFVYYILYSDIFNSTYQDYYKRIVAIDFKNMVVYKPTKNYGGISSIRVDNANKRLYVVAYSAMAQPAGTYKYDISNPTSPVQVAFISTLVSVICLNDVGTRLYASDATGYVSIYNVEANNQFSVISSVPFSTFGFSSYVRWGGTPFYHNNRVYFNPANFTYESDYTTAIITLSVNNDIFSDPRTSTPRIPSSTYHGRFIDLI